MSSACASDQAILSARLRRLCLLAIMLVAVLFRFYGLSWDAEVGVHPNPDEQYLADRLFRVSLKRPIQWAQLLDPRTSSLNPRRINPNNGRFYRLEWGTFMVYVPRGIAAALDVIGFHALDTYEGYFLVGRVVSAVCSLLTILLTFLLASTLYGEIAGLIGAAALALTVTDIQLSHFMIVDVPLTMFAALTLCAAVRFAQRGERTSAFLMGLGLGGALASKLPGATLVLSLAAAYLLRIVAPAQEFQVTSRPLRLAQVIYHYLPWTTLGFLLTFGFFEFYALLNPAAYLGVLGAPMVLGNGEWQSYFAGQFIGTRPYLYQIENLVRWEMGWPLGVFAILATLWAVFQLVTALLKKRNRLHLPQTQGLLVVVAWAAPYFLYIGALAVKYNRYMLPLAPVLCVLVGGLAVELSKRLKRRIGLPRWLLPLAILAATLCWALAYTSIYARPHTWLEASRWLYANLPAGAVVASPNWSQRLPVDIPAEGQRWQEHLGGQVKLDIYLDMSPEAKFEHLMAGLRQADAIVLSTQGEYNSVSRMPWRYPVEIRFFQLLFEERLGYELAHVAVSYPSIGPFTMVDDAAEESFSIYDHPKVLIYMKKSNPQPDELKALFADALSVVPVVSIHGSAPPAKIAAPSLDSERVRALLRNTED
jgi:hypothetical protein